MKSEFNKEQLDFMTKNPDNWKWGIFYFNPKDPRMSVPKQNPMRGWTINCASPKAWLLFIGMVLLIAAVGYFL